MKIFFEKRVISYVILFIVVFVFFIRIHMRPEIGYAVYPDMEMNASPNPVGSGARALGIGGAFISIADDATAASWNPGGLLQLKKPEISIVGSYFSGNTAYETSGVDGDIDDKSPDIKHLNYLSAVVPFMFFRQNAVFSLNYQHLYEFSQKNIAQRRVIVSGASSGIHLEDQKHQSGSLDTVSPALALQIHPRFFLGLTFNFWGLVDSGWENLSINYTEGIGVLGKHREHKEVYEDYDFSGFNMHIGFLFKSRYHKIRGKNMRFRIGGVIKTPFDADIRHEKREFLFTDYPEDPVNNDYYESPPIFRDFTLKMPLSYGLGISWDFSHYFSVACDVYRTHWESYILKYSTGEEWSPINIELKEDADIKPTTQVRLGAEYIIENTRRRIPIRVGAFYDPEPAGGRPDDFYGISFGSGIIYNDLFSLDFAYQFRFGRKRNAEVLQYKDISGEVSQHFFYASVIYYLF
jgi:hypothetical protein